MYHDVEEQHPVKQGLKLHPPQINSCVRRVVEEQHPVKQGLKLNNN